MVVVVVVVEGERDYTSRISAGSARRSSTAARPRSATQQALPSSEAVWVVERTTAGLALVEVPSDPDVLREEGEELPGVHQEGVACISCSGTARRQHRLSLLR